MPETEKTPLELETPTETESSRSSKSRSSAPTVAPWATGLVRSFEDDASHSFSYWSSRHDWRELETGRQIFDHADPVELVAAALMQLHDLRERRPDYYGSLWTRCYLLAALAGRLMRRPLPWPQDRLAAIIDHCAASIIDPHLVNAPYSTLPPMLKQIEQVAAGGKMDGRLTAAVVGLSEQAAKSEWVGSPHRAALARLVERLSGDTRQTAGLAASPWRDKVLADVDRLPADAAATSRRALEQAAGAIGKSKPGQVFLKAARALLAEDDELAVRLVEWIEAYVPDPGQPDPNEDVMRGLIWMLAMGEGEAVASRLGKHCELCFRKVPGIGARSLKLGNGAIQTLALLGGNHAVAELTRLKGRIKYPLVVRKVEAALSELAGRLGMGEDELTELALPTLGLSPGGERRVPVGDGSAIIRVAGTRDVQLAWTRPDGREMASIPKALKDAAPDAVKAARALKKEIEGAIAGQAARIEGLYLSGRRIPFDQWRERYLEHPLIANLTRRLIWRFESAGGQHVAAMAHDGTIEDVTGRPVELSSGLAVTLWHPLHAEASHVLAWRRRIAALKVSQPFKQAHREIYVVTDAERQTDIYSNRFAAHILRQHQFKALCDQRSWRYHLMGAWDSHNTPTRVLSGQRLSVEFWVDMVQSSENENVYALISTDQVRFISLERGPVPVADVPPLVFSELMRDVDLFVGVASLGNDPDWADGGPEGRFQNYWSRFAFGDLSESGKTRADVLAALVPQLAIAGQCVLEGHFLVVRGKLRTYRIHLGSGNIQMEPNNQYLCIVPGRGQSDRSRPEEGLVLPFEGDTILSIILSKAFLLAADDRITDPTIVRQIERH